LEGENRISQRNSCTVTNLMDYSHPAIKNLYLEGEFLSRKQAHRSFVPVVNAKVLRSWLSMSNEEGADAAAEE
jgi:hypothetical protein